MELFFIKIINVTNKHFGLCPTLDDSKYLKKRRRKDNFTFSDVFLTKGCKAEGKYRSVMASGLLDHPKAPLV